MKKFTAWQLRSHRVGVLSDDDQILVLDKPSGLLVIPDRFDASRPNILGLLKADGEPAFIVHRLDRETSGCLIVARTPEAHAALSEQFERRDVTKLYVALCTGGTGEEGVIDLPLHEHELSHTMRVDRKRGKPSRTAFAVQERFPGYALVEARPETGRMHQVRVHLAAVGYPVVSDPLYGDGEPLFLSRIKRGYKPGSGEERPLIDRTALHAASVTFRHPADGAAVSFSSPLHKDMRSAVRALAKYAR